MFQQQEIWGMTEEKNLVCQLKAHPGPDESHLNQNYTCNNHVLKNHRAAWVWI